MSGARSISMILAVTKESRQRNSFRAVLRTRQCLAGRGLLLSTVP